MAASVPPAFGVLSLLECIAPAYDVAGGATSEPDEGGAEDKRHPVAAEPWRPRGNETNAYIQ